MNNGSTASAMMYSSPQKASHHNSLYNNLVTQDGSKQSQVATYWSPQKKGTNMGKMALLGGITCYDPTLNLPKSNYYEPVLIQNSNNNNNSTFLAQRGT